MAFYKACLGKLLVGGVLICTALFTSSVASAQESEKVDFVKQIKPIFENRCLSCHCEDKEEGGFRIDDIETLLEDWVYAEDGEGSPMVEEYIRSDDEDFMMPPPPANDGDGPLSEEDISLIVRWIDEGANWPEDVKLVLPADDATGGEADNNPQESPQSETPDENAADAAQAADAGSKKTKPERKAKPYNPIVWNAIGSLHPAAIHLPVGLLLAAGLFALLGMRGNFVMSDCAYYCLWLGTIGAIVGCVTGWWFSPMEGKGTVEAFNDLLDMKQPVFWHRTSALVITVFAFLLALFAAGARNRDPDDGFLWKLGLILLAAGIGWVGHEGGKLTYGKRHYRDLNGTVEAISGWDADGNGVVDQWEDEAPEDEDADKPAEEDQAGEDVENGVVGKTSEEGAGDGESQAKPLDAQ